MWQMSDSPASLASDAQVADADGAPAPGRAVRHFGRFQLLALLGRSTRTMAWRVDDPRTRQELILVLPRQQPGDALEGWRAAVRKASRLKHPNLAAVVETDVVDGWPYAAYDPRDAPTLAERLAGDGLPPAGVAAWGQRLLEGLAFAHDGGVAHHDVQPYLVLLADNGQPRLIGTEVALEEGMAAPHTRGAAALDADAMALPRADA
jgi:eukaryotic-like serine/threonine-protein kinase